MSASVSKESPCPDCGEMVRVNALRCWNCGGFMNPEMEQKFLAMQANPAPTIFSQVPVDEMESVEDTDEADDDFQLSMPSSRPIRILEEEPAPAEAATEPPEPLTAPAAPAASPPRDRKPEEPAVAHSVATGGDALLDIARQEQRELNKRLKGRRMTGGTRTPGGGLIIYCPYGCRVEVKEAHRGMTGKCPRCDAPFIVPVAPPNFKVKAAPESAAGPVDEKVTFQSWINDLHLHTVDPQKLKIKADSLLKEFVEADVGCAPDTLLVAVLGKKAAGGLFAKGGSGDTKSASRAEMRKHLAEGKPASGLNVAEKLVFTADQARELRIVQPAANPSQNIFHGIPVFGAGRIAVQLPFVSDGGHPRYLSMGITQFWALRKALESAYGLTGLGADVGLPTDHKYSIFKCHFMEIPIKALANAELYKSDPTVQLEVAGYQCGSCKTAVSEVGRKQKSLGGKSPKGIAKAKCPKCATKMGEHLLYSLKQDVAEPTMSAPAS